MNVSVAIVAFGVMFVAAAVLFVAAARRPDRPWSTLAVWFSLALGVAAIWGGVLLIIITIAAPQL